MPTGGVFSFRRLVAKRLPFCSLSSVLFSPSLFAGGGGVCNLKGLAILVNSQQVRHHSLARHLQGSRDWDGRF